VSFLSRALRAREEPYVRLSVMLSYSGQIASYRNRHC
jgi:hypothetical protein